MFKRIFIIVLDSVGIGAMPDAEEFGDIGVNTLSHVADYCGGLKLPVLESMGLGLIESIKGVSAVNAPRAAYGKMAELSRGKDTTSGHWEIAGYPLFQSFPVYPQGFPTEVIEKFSLYTGLKVLGNKPASGTEIMAELGQEHMLTGLPIVYTSADSVFQIAAHEEIIPLPRLYELCKIAREKVCVGEHAVGRIIARPFIGKPGSFVRTANRHDYSLEPKSHTMLDILKEQGFSVIGVGKIGDIYANRGLTKSYPTKSNNEGMEVVLKLVGEEQSQGIIMANLVDFDSVYGHRNDAEGYGRALEEFDYSLGSLIEKMEATDLLIITADHGCDPTAPGTDHTREYVPLVVYHPSVKAVNLGVRTTFADVSATVLDNFSLPPLAYGQSFLRLL